MPVSGRSSQRVWARNQKNKISTLHGRYDRAGRSGGASIIVNRSGLVKDRTSLIRGGDMASPTLNLP